MVFDHSYPSMVNQKISSIIVWIIEPVRFGTICQALEDILSVLNKHYYFPC